MRRAAKVDANQSDIVRAFRQMGATVALTHTTGGGFPDLVVGYRGQNFLVEVKDPNAVNKADRELRENQRDFHRDWRGQVCVVRTIQDAHDVLRMGGKTFGR